MSIPPIAVAVARSGWNWQWNQLMERLAPADNEGNYNRPPSQHQKAIAPSKQEIKQRSPQNRPYLIIGRSCPWAHRTWLVYELRELHNSLNLLIAKADHNTGRWTIDPPWLGCNSLLDVYQKCGQPPNHRATVPALIDPGKTNTDKPQLLGNESTQLIEVLNQWPTNNRAPNLLPPVMEKDVERWHELLQTSVNDGVYRCGFARNQNAYDRASNELFESLALVEESLMKRGPWLCGEQITLADVRLFPTLIRWEMIYQPLFGCSQEPLWSFPNLWEWRQKFLSQQQVLQTCDSKAWRNDYYGALFPLRPSNIVPAGPDLLQMINAPIPSL